jgi:hypothetical protein
MIEAAYLHSKKKLMQFFNISHPVIKSLCMRKLIVTLTVINVLYNHIVAQNWDRSMMIKKMDIRIQTDVFAATTNIEMEFYNPTNIVVENVIMDYQYGDVEIGTVKW